MYAPNPQKITNDLLDRANKYLANWPPDELSIGRLRRDSEKLRKVSSSDYEMMLGICATLVADKEGMTKHFESSIKKAPGKISPVKNYALSLNFLNYDDEACQIFRSNYDLCKGDVDLLTQFTRTLLSAGRFHEAAKEFGQLKKLGVSANFDLENLKRIPELQDSVDGIADNDVAEIVRYFGNYLRDIGALNISVYHATIDADNTDQGRSGVEFHFGVREDTNTASDLDFSGSEFMAEADFELQRNGVIVLTINCQIKDVDADQAA